MIEQIYLVYCMCSLSVIEPAGLYFAHYNIPVFTHGATDRVFADKDTYQTLVRVGPNYNYYGDAFVEIFKRFQWTRTVMLVRQTKTCDYGATDIDEAFYENGLTVAEWTRVDDRRVITDKQIDGYLDKLSQQARGKLITNDSRKQQTSVRVSLT